MSTRKRHGCRDRHEGVIRERWKFDPYIQSERYGQNFVKYTFPIQHFIYVTMQVPQKPGSSIDPASSFAFDNPAALLRLRSCPSDGLLDGFSKDLSALEAINFSITQ